MDDEKRNDQYQQSPQSGQQGDTLPDESRDTETAAPITQKRSYKKSLIIGALIAAVLLLIGGAVWAYMAANSPQNTLKAAVRNLSEQDAVAADFTLITKEDDIEDAIEGDVSFKRDSDNEKNFELSGGVSEEDARVGLNFRNVDEAYYIQVTGLDNLAAFAPDEASRAELESPFMQTYVTSLNDQWFTSTHEDVEQLLSNGTGYDTKETLSDEDIEKIENLYDEHQFLVIEERDSEIVADVETRHFMISLDHGQLVAFAEALKDANIAAVTLTDEDIQSLKDEKDAVEDVRVEAWVTDDNMFKQLQFYGAEDSENKATFTFRDTEVGDFKVEAPEDAEDLTQILQLLTGVANGTETQAMPESDPARLQ